MIKHMLTVVAVLLDASGPHYMLCLSVTGKDCRAEGSAAATDLRVA